MLCCKHEIILNYFVYNINLKTFEKYRRFYYCFNVFWYVFIGSIYIKANHNSDGQTNWWKKWYQRKIVWYDMMFVCVSSKIISLNVTNLSLNICQLLSKQLLTCCETWHCYLQSQLIHTTLSLNNDRFTDNLALTCTLFLNIFTPY